MKHLSIKLRITLLSALLTAAAALMAVSALWVGEQSMLQKYHHDSLAATARLARDDIRYEAGELNIDRNLDELPNVRVALFTRDGDLIYGQSRFDLPLVDQSFREAEDMRKELWYVHDTKLSPEGGRELWLRLYISQDATQSMRGIRAGQLLLLVPAIIALAGLGGYGIARHALRPVAKIAATAESIAEGRDLKKRISLSGAKDELYRLASTFDGMLTRLEDAFERERRFTSDASHELRTPVTAILAQSEGALETHTSGEERLQALQSIHASAERMAQLIRGLLYLSRMDARQYPLELEEVDLSMLAEMAVQSLNDAAKARGMHIQVRASGPVTALCDQTMLMQSLLNLVENAIRHGGEGGHIQVHVLELSRSARIVVEDDGPGIKEEDLERIFDRFFQADAARTNPGSGLGLPLARHIVKLHGGQLTAQSQPGKGSRFAITLPKAGEHR